MSFVFDDNVAGAGLDDIDLIAVVWVLRIDAIRFVITKLERSVFQKNPVPLVV